MVKKLTWLGLPLVLLLSAADPTVIVNPQSGGGGSSTSVSFSNGAVIAGPAGGGIDLLPAEDGGLGVQVYIPTPAGSQRLMTFYADGGGRVGLFQTVSPGNGMDIAGIYSVEATNLSASTAVETGNQFQYVGNGVGTLLNVNNAGWNFTSNTDGNYDTLLASITDGGVFEVKDYTGGSNFAQLSQNGTATVLNDTANSLIQIKGAGTLFATISTTGVNSASNVTAQGQLQTTFGQVLESDGSADQPFQFLHLTAQTGAGGAYSYQFFNDNGTTQLVGIYPSGEMVLNTDAGTKAPVPTVSGVNGAAPSALPRFEGVALGFDKAQAADAGFKVPFSVAPQCVWTATYTDGGLGLGGADACVSTTTTGVTLFQCGTPANGTEVGNALCWGY